MSEGVCPICIQNVSGLILNTKVLPLIIELVVILNHLYVCFDMILKTRLSHKNADRQLK